MIPKSPLLNCFTVVEVRDPAEMDEGSRISGRLPGPDGVHIYTLRDPALRRIAAGPLLTRHADRQAGDLMLGHVAEQFGTEVGILEPGLPAYCFTLVRSGRVALSVPGAVRAHKCLDWDVPARSRARSLPRRSIGAAPLRARARLGKRRGRWDAPAPPAPGPGLLRPDGLATNAPGLAAFADLLVHTSMRGLPHNYAERLGRQRDGVAPACVRRAESYFRDHADQPIRLEDAAAAAGCSSRALQRAFAGSATPRPTPPCSGSGWSWRGPNWRASANEAADLPRASASPTPAASRKPTPSVSASFPRSRSAPSGLALGRPPLNTSGS